VAVFSWLIAIAAAMLPRREWHRFEPPLPVHRAAIPAALLTVALGFGVGFNGFLRYAGGMASANNAAMLESVQRSIGRGETDEQAMVVTPGPAMFSAFALFAFVLLTPTGWLATYLVGSGTVRAVSAAVDDPRGDFILSGLQSLARSSVTGSREQRARRNRERREGPEVADLLGTAAWAGVAGDYVVIASRRKAGWEPGVLVLTNDDWFRIGTVTDVEVDGRLRTLYALTRLETVEVVRRSVEYTLPRLSPRFSRASSGRAPS
jgi:hypothetical protein